MLLSDWQKKFSLLELLDKCTGNGSTDLELFAEDSSGNAENLGNFLEHSFEAGLFQIDGIIKLFLNLNLCP